MLQDLVRVLQSVPEKRLALFKLAWELVDEHGDIDPDKALGRGQELQLAIQEMQIVREENNKLVEALIRWSQDRDTPYR